MLEMEKSTSQKNLDSVVELETEETLSAREKYREVIMVRFILLHLFSCNS